MFVDANIYLGNLLYSLLKLIGCIDSLDVYIDWLKLIGYVQNGDQGSEDRRRLGGGKGSGKHPQFVEGELVVIVPEKPLHTESLLAGKKGPFVVCDGGARPESIDPFGYHFVGCRTGANAIRLHDEVVAVVARLFRSLRLVAIR